MQITALSTELPELAISTKELIETFPCRLPELVQQNVLNLGVQNRHLLNDLDPKRATEEVMNHEGLIDLCVEACRKAISKAGLCVRDIDYLISTYEANPFLSPGLGQLLLPDLGLDCYTKYANAQGIASSAFPKALDIAQNYLALHPDNHVLTCMSGVTSYWFQNQVRGLRDLLDIKQINQISDAAKRSLEMRKWVATMEYFLFGDGVAAAVVSNTERGLAVKGIEEVTNVRKMDCLAGYVRLSSLNEPFKFGFVSHLGRDIPRLGVEYTDLALRKLLGDDGDAVIKKAKKWVVHTGSVKILDALAEKFYVNSGKLEESRVVLEKCGNLAGASLPFILDRIILQDVLSNGDLVLMVGYGWGFSACACLLKSISWVS